MLVGSKNYMAKESLRKRILSFYQRHADIWIPGTEIERLTLEHTPHKSSNASRRLRELCEDGMLDRKEEGGHVWYKYKPQKKTVTEYKVINGVAVAFNKEIII
jgi:hypothetical protein